MLKKFIKSIFPKQITAFMIR